ncbi:MAG: hypothetical protein ACLP8A_09400 [Methylovirgula sp.]
MTKSMALARVSSAILVAALAVLPASAAPLTAPSGTSDHPTYVKAIIFGEQRIDQSHMFEWRDWTIGFGLDRAFSESNQHGMTLRGLRCTNVTSGTLNCHLFMAMQPFESRPHFCEISPDDSRAPGSWPLHIKCPTEIDFEH